jgi:hypothetical protein
LVLLVLLSIWLLQAAAGVLMVAVAQEDIAQAHNHLPQELPTL